MSRQYWERTENNDQLELIYNNARNVCMNFYISYESFEATLLYPH